MVAWLQTWWLRVPMPRELSVAFTLLYVLALGAGLVTLVYPPDSLSQEVGGPQVMASVSALCIRLRLHSPKDPLPPPFPAMPALYSTSGGAS